MVSKDDDDIIDYWKTGGKIHSLHKIAQKIHAIMYRESLSLFLDLEP